MNNFRNTTNVALFCVLNSIFLSLYFLIQEVVSDSPALNNTFLEAGTATISNVEGNLATCENNPITLVGVSRRSGGGGGNSRFQLTGMIEGFLWV